MWNNSGQLKKMQLQQGQHSMSREDYQQDFRFIQNQVRF